MSTVGICGARQIRHATRLGCARGMPRVIDDHWRSMIMLCDQLLAVVIVVTRHGQFLSRRLAAPALDFEGILMINPSYIQEFVVKSTNSKFFIPIGSHKSHSSTRRQEGDTLFWAYGHSERNLWPCDTPICKFHDQWESHRTIYRCSRLTYWKSTPIIMLIFFLASPRRRQHPFDIQFSRQIRDGQRSPLG